MWSRSRAEGIGIKGTPASYRPPRKRRPARAVALLRRGVADERQDVIVQDVGARTAEVADGRRAAAGREQKSCNQQQPQALHSRADRLAA